MNTMRIRLNRRRNSGVVMVIALLGLVLMTALVMNVINLGQQVNTRLSTQNSADAAAAAAATSVARTLNTVSMNNLAMAKYIALIPILDAMPQAAEYTLREQTSLMASLERQLASGAAGPGQHAALAQEVVRYLEQLKQEMEVEIDELDPVVQEFLQVDGVDLTHYNGGQGKLWQAMQALDEINQGLMENLALVSQMGAGVGGKANMASDASSAAMMLPLAGDQTPLVPWQRGYFNDFLRPVRYGLLPLEVDDPLVNRGAYDVLYGWRQFDVIVEGGTWVPGSQSGSVGGQASSLGGNGAGGGNGQLVGATSYRRAYRTWGPYEQMLRQVSNYVQSRLRHTRLVSPYPGTFSYRNYRGIAFTGNGYLNRLSNQKLNYLWPDPRATSVFEPEWVTDWQEATAIADSEPARIKETAFYYVEIKSRYPVTDGAFLSPGSWSLEAVAGRDNPGLTIRRDGNRQRWVNDPRRWPNNAPAGVFPRRIKINDHMWRDENRYMVNFDQSIGITPIQNTDGTYVPQPVYRVDHWVFAGVNIGEPARVANPFAGFDPGAPDAPAPTDIDHVQVTALPESRYDHLTYLGVAKQTDLPNTWPAKFRGGRPYPYMVGIAQATVFNNHSWDLWTPMWHAQLEPISNRDGQPGLRDWMERQGDKLPASMSQQELEELLGYLKNVAEGGETLFRH